MPASRRSKVSALANPTNLDSFHRKSKETTSGAAEPGEELLQVVIETPRGSRNKFSFDAEQRIFHLKSQLPLGMVFPWDFGFVPGTLGGDGDALDALVLMDEPAFPGCALFVRLLGAMEIEQTERGKTKRNDRLIAVAEVSQLFADMKSIDDLPCRVLTEIDEFFTTYHRLQGKQSRTLRWIRTAQAQRLVSEARHRKSAS